MRAIVKGNGSRPGHYFIAILKQDPWLPYRDSLFNYPWVSLSWSQVLLLKRLDILVF